MAALLKDTASVYAKTGEGEENVGQGIRVWPGDQLIVTFAHGQTVEFVITNLDDGDHPFHLHGHSATFASRLGVRPLQTRDCPP